MYWIMVTFRGKGKNDRTSFEFIYCLCSIMMGLKLINRNLSMSVVRKSNDVSLFIGDID